MQNILKVNLDLIYIIYIIQNFNFVNSRQSSDSEGIIYENIYRKKVPEINK